MDEISTGISRRGSVLGGVTAGVAAMAAGGLDTSIVGLIRGYACRRGFQLFHVLLILKKPGKMSPALGSLPNGKPITLYHVLYENPRELEAFSDVSGISSLSGSKLMPGDFKPLTCINGLEAIYLATSGQPLRLCTP